MRNGGARRVFPVMATSCSTETVRHMATAASTDSRSLSEAVDEQIEGVVRAPTTGVRADARQACLLQALGGRSRGPRHSDPAGNLRPQVRPRTGRPGNSPGTGRSDMRTTARRGERDCVGRSSCRSPGRVRVGNDSWLGGAGGNGHTGSHDHGWRRRAGRAVRPQMTRVG